MTAHHKIHGSVISNPLFSAYLAAVDDSVKSSWNTFFAEEGEVPELLYSLLSTNPMLETRLRSLERGILMSGNWSPAKRHQHLSLVNDWINYCRFRGETDLCIRLATASLTRPKNPASTEKTAVALRLYNSLRDTLYKPVTPDTSYSTKAQVGRALLSGILFGGLLCERTIWAVLRAIREKPINLNGLPAYSLSISRNGFPEAETKLWVPDALTGALIGNLHQNQVDLMTIVSEKRQSGSIMPLIQTWIGESSDLKLLKIINDGNSPGRNSVEGAERGARKRVTLNYLLELTRTIYGLSIPAALIDYFSGQFPSHSLPLSRLLDTSNSVIDTTGKPGADHEHDRESEVTSVLNLAAASLATDSGAPAHAVKVGASPSPTLLPTAKSMG